jgi:hypothetical protein
MEDAFCNDKSRRTGKHPWCRDCRGRNSQDWYIQNKDKVVQQAKNWAQRNPEKRKRIYNRWRRKNMALMRQHVHQYRGLKTTTAECEKLFLSQKGQCAICDTAWTPGSKMLSLDHDHKTGRIRGLLCDRCNLGLGKFRDDVSLLRRAIQYLEQRS